MPSILDRAFKGRCSLIGTEQTDIKNPNAKEDFEHMPPEQLVEDIMKKEERIAGIMNEIRQVLLADKTKS